MQYGITRDVPTTLQRGGRGGRSPTGKAIFLLMYEPWAKSINLATVEVDTSSNPDHPNIPKLTVHSTKQARTGVAMLWIVQLEKECLRKSFATYLKDTTFDGMYMRCTHACMLIAYDPQHCTSRLNGVVIDTLDRGFDLAISSRVGCSTKTLKTQHCITGTKMIQSERRFSHQYERRGKKASRSVQ